jgi:hypothetical protein
MVDFPTWFRPTTQISPFQVQGQAGLVDTTGFQGDDTPPAGALGGSDDVPPSQQRFGASSTGGTPDLPPGDVPPGGYGVTTVSLQSLRLQPNSVQDLAKVIFEANLEQRKAAREDRAAKRDANIEAQQKVADEIRSQAAFAFAASMVSAGISIVGAAINIGSQVKSMKVEAQAQKLQTHAQKLDIDAGKAELSQQQTMQNARFMRDDALRTEAHQKAGVFREEAATLKTEATDLRADAAKFSNQAQGLTQKGAASQQIGSAVGQMGGASLNFLAAEQEEDKARAQAESEKQRTAAEDQTDFIRAYEENMRKVLDVLQAVQQAEADTNRTIARA